MAWSTQALADVAGTTVNTIRHYHRLGLLPEPHRRRNGYKQYGVNHLVGLLRIRRLTELGVPLSRIAAVCAEGGVGTHILREVDGELAAELERLRRLRNDIADILRDGAPPDAPAGFTSVAPRLSPSHSSFLHIVSQLCDEDALTDLRRMVDTDEDPVNDEFDALPPDADEAIRQRLIARLAPVLARHLADYPWLSDPSPRLVKNEDVTRQTLIAAVADIYNVAQIDVLSRAGVLAREQPQATGPAR